MVKIMKKTCRCLLINPPTGLYIREDRCQSSVEDLPNIVDHAPVIE
jgi:hypothetical protein